MDWYLLWYSLITLLALLYLISKLSVWLWASASRWLTTLHSVWASCQYLKKKKKKDCWLILRTVRIVFLNIFVILHDLDFIVKTDVRILTNP